MGRAIAVPGKGGLLCRYTRSVSCRSVNSPRQIRRPHQEPVDRLGAEAALADGPDHERLAAAHVAGGEHVGTRGLVVDEIGADIAALVEIDAEQLQQALV